MAEHSVSGLLPKLPLPLALLSMNSNKCILRHSPFKCINKEKDGEAMVLLPVLILLASVECFGISGSGSSKETP